MSVYLFLSIGLVIIFLLVTILALMLDNWQCRTRIIINISHFSNGQSTEECWQKVVGILSHQPKTIDISMHFYDHYAAPEVSG